MACQVPNWSRIGRLKRSKFPSLTGGGHTFGGGAGAGLLSATAGRLLCDTYLGARELLREVGHRVYLSLGGAPGLLSATPGPGVLCNTAERLLCEIDLVLLTSVGRPCLREIMCTRYADPSMEEPACARSC